MSVAPDAATVEVELMAVWTARGIDPDRLATDADGTLHTRSDAVDGATLDAWQALGLAPDGQAAPGPARPLVELGVVIGEGGMGVVRAAVQAALRRPVAVKELHPERVAPASIAALLREAWVAGNLEHPNIVPVHALVPGDAGPRLVMKRVEGTPWFPHAAGGPDAIDRDLEVLERVCHAVHFAHSRGVLHLDLKPANVMLGAFGEVYLVDWGIAVGYGADPPPWLTRAADLATVCGTPGYLAPEMASGDGPAVGVATDVYGLGALLHEVLTGRPPHRGHTLRDLLLAAFASPPIEFGPGVPKELAAIANRAMARDPAQRFPSAAAFRQALEGFRAHRSAARLTEDADRRLDALIARASVRASVRASADDAELERLAGECRLAYDQALALWPESPEAQAGKARLLEHLRRDQAARDAEVAALRRLGRDTDVNANRLSRSRLAMITGALWLLWNLGSAFAVEQLGWRLDYAALFASAGGTVVVCAIGLSLFRRSLATTAIDRSILGLFAAMFAVVVLFWIGTAQVGLDPMRAIAAAHPFYLAFALSLAFFFDRRCLLPALAIAPATPLAPLVPEHALEIAGLVGGVLSLWLALIWRRPATAPIFAARVE